MNIITEIAKEKDIVPHIIEYGKKLGLTITEEDAGWILWEHTGYPIFSPDRKDRIKFFKMQAEQFLKSCVPRKGV